MKKTDGTTIALNGDILEIIKSVQGEVERYELLPLSAVVRQLILEGCNRVHGDAISTDYVQVITSLKRR